MARLTVKGTATYHMTGKSGVNTTVKLPFESGVLLKSWLPSMVATVVVGRKAMVMKARTLMELECSSMTTESDVVRRLKERVMELVTRSCRLPRRILVERKSDCLCRRESWSCCRTLGAPSAPVEGMAEGSGLGR